jgi:hypothetical protein
MTGSSPSHRRFQFRLRTLMIGGIVVAALAAIALRIVYERRMRDQLVGRWVGDIYGHKNGYALEFNSRRQVYIRPNVPPPRPDGVGGNYLFNPADGTAELTVYVDTGGRDMEKRTHHVRLTEDDTLIVDEHGPGPTLQLTRDKVGGSAN